MAGEPIVELARAKLNLTLRVFGKRTDGYHELESLVTFADVGDVVMLTPDAAPGVTVSGPFGAEIVGPNLALSALAAVAAAAPGVRLGHVHIDKRLPVASGIGGGSADAAAVLRALCQLNHDRAAEIRLGADVTACVLSRLLIMRGVGELIELVQPRPVAAIAVLVTPRVQLPANKTAAVFKALGAGPVAVTHRLGLPFTGNDLEPPAIAVMPEIAAVLARLRACPGVSRAQLSGAGPTCFALFEDAALADDAAMAVRADHPAAWVCRTTVAIADA
jgi:4-diphosphocytidyl-2-C-methyl-D-erythritol kinase